MHLDELWETLQLYKTIFPDTWRWIVDAKNKCYHIEIKNGHLWINHPTWASTIKMKSDLNLHYPVEMYSDDLPPHHCLFGLYKATFNETARSQVKIGQWFMDKYMRSHVDPEIYNEKDSKVALELIYERWYK